MKAAGQATVRLNCAHRKLFDMSVNGRTRTNYNGTARRHFTTWVRKKLFFLGFLNVKPSKVQNLGF